MPGIGRTVDRCRALWVLASEQPLFVTWNIAIQKNRPISLACLNSCAIVEEME